MMRKSDKAKHLLGVFVILAIIVSVFGGAASAEDLSGGLKQSVVDKAPSKDNTISDEEYGVVSAEDVSRGLKRSVVDKAPSKDNIISDEEYRDYQSMSLSEIQSFLENPKWGDGYLGRASYLATYTTTDYQGVERSAAEIIYNAARDYVSQGYQISPEVIITTLEKEQSLITDPNPSAKALNWAMGYGPYGQWMGFGKQVDAGGWQLGSNYKYIETHGSKNGWGVGISKQTLDGVTITPQNIATACLYAYTPHAGAGWGGSEGGNYLFWDLYYNMFHLPCECEGTDTSCGIYPDCENCNEKDGCYAYDDGCEERNYDCVSNEAGCSYTGSNRHTDYLDDWIYYCKGGDEVWKHRLFHDFYCEGGTCTDHTSWEDDQLVEDCNDRDSDTGWVYYCSGDDVWRFREAYDYYCVDGGCVWSNSYADEFVEDCGDEY